MTVSRFCTAGRFRGHAVKGARHLATRRHSCRDALFRLCFVNQSNNLAYVRVVFMIARMIELFYWVLCCLVWEHFACPFLVFLVFLLGGFCRSRHGPRSLVCRNTLFLMLQRKTENIMFLPFFVLLLCCGNRSFFLVGGYDIRIDYRGTQNFT